MSLKFVFDSEFSLPLKDAFLKSTFLYVLHRVFIIVFLLDL